MDQLPRMANTWLYFHLLISNMFFLNTSTPLLSFNFPFAQSLGLPILPSFLLSFLPSFLLTLPPSAASRDCKGHLNPVWPSADDGDASRAESAAPKFVALRECLGIEIQVDFHYLFYNCNVSDHLEQKQVKKQKKKLVK